MVNRNIIVFGGNITNVANIANVAPGQPYTSEKKYT